jgi:16S rRNA G1207 methylase RsmC
MEAVVRWQLMTFDTRQSMFTKAKQKLQAGGACELVYNRRAALRCAIFMDKRYGIKEYS